MGFEMTITSKGQMTVPKIVRDQLNMQPGDKCYAWVRNGEMIVIPRNKPLSGLVGFLQDATPAPAAVTEDDARRAMADAAIERYLRSADKEREDGDA